MVLDLSLREAAYEALEGAERVYNLSADMGGMGFIENNKALCMLSVLPSTNLLMAARDHGVSRFFYASSACVYAAANQDSPSSASLVEPDAYPAMPEDGYGWEKLFSERMARHFMEDFGLDVRIGRYHNVYGPLGTWEGGREKAPAAICRKVLEAKKSKQRSIDIWGNGEQTRSFMYIEDCVEGTLRLMESNFSDPINIGSSERVSINELVSIAEQIAGLRLERKYDLSQPQGVAGRNSDNTLIRQALGWEPSTPLATGLQKTYQWIKEQMYGE
jgi:nucleoside-diphosphate-sugar epimerase